MTKITVTISDQEMNALKSMIDEEIQQWLQHLVQTRAHKAKLEIADRFRKRATDEGIPIPVGLENIVQKASDLGWLKNQS